MKKSTKVISMVLAFAMVLGLAGAIGTAGAASAAGVEYGDSSGGVARGSFVVQFPENLGGGTVGDIQLYGGQGQPWWAEAVEWAQTWGVLRGTGSGDAELDRYITRAEFVTMVNRMYETYVRADLSRYTDVSYDAWYYDDIAMGVQMGTVKGVSDTEMLPDGLITREQAAVIMARALALSNGTPEDLARFYDCTSVSDWAVVGVASMVKLGCVNGKPADILDPQAYITRAEVVQMLSKGFKMLTYDVRSGEYDCNVVLRKWDFGQPIEVSDVTCDRTLVIAVGVGDGRVDIHNSKIERLVCWGAGDVYIWGDVEIGELVVCRTDGPCVIHWMGSTEKIPAIVIPPEANEDNVVVDGQNDVVAKKEPVVDPDDPGGITDPNNPDNPDNPDDPGHGGQTGGGSSSKPTKPSTDNNVVYFNPMNGKSTFTKKINSEGYVEQPEDPVWEGHIFVGWYWDRDCTRRFNFSDKPDKRMTLYAKWAVRGAESDILEELNQTVRDSMVRIQAEIDVLAYAEADYVPCKITNASESGVTVRVELRLSDGTLVGHIDSLESGDTATKLVLDYMPGYGNYAAYLAVAPVAGGNAVIIETALYVAYEWGRG